MKTNTEFRYWKILCLSISALLIFNALLLVEQPFQYPFWIYWAMAYLYATYRLVPWPLLFLLCALGDLMMNQMIGWTALASIPAYMLAVAYEYHLGYQRFLGVAFSLWISLLGYTLLRMILMMYDHTLWSWYELGTLWGVGWGLGWLATPRTL